MNWIQLFVIQYSESFTLIFQVPPFLNYLRQYWCRVIGDVSPTANDHDDNIGFKIVETKKKVLSPSRIESIFYKTFVKFSFVNRIELVFWKFKSYKN